RLLDTRTGGARLNNAWRDVTVAGAAGIPNEGVAAVALNVTAVSPTNSGYLTVYPAGSPRPGVSTLNYDSGDVVANAAVTTVGYVSGDGKVRVYSSGATHVLIDVVGWFAEADTPAASDL